MVPAYCEVFVVREVADIIQNKRPLPGIAPVAIQSGRYTGQVIARRVAAEPALSPFVYGASALWQPSSSIMRISSPAASGSPVLSQSPHGASFTSCQLDLYGKI